MFRAVAFHLPVFQPQGSVVTLKEDDPVPTMLPNSFQCDESVFVLVCVCMHIG